MQTVCEIRSNNLKLYVSTDNPDTFKERLVVHIKLFPQCDEHLFFSVPGVRNHLPHVMRMLSVTNFQNGVQVKEGN